MKKYTKIVYSGNRDKNNMFNKILKQMPDNFTTSEFINKAKEFNIKSSNAKVMLSRNIKLSINKLAHAKYSKINY